MSQVIASTSAVRAASGRKLRLLLPWASAAAQCSSIGAYVLAFEASFGAQRLYPAALDIPLAYGILLCAGVLGLGMAAGGLYLNLRDGGWLAAAVSAALCLPAVLLSTIYLYVVAVFWGWV
jgi:hypothetical protein